MTTSEKRSIRREIINYCIQKSFLSNAPVIIQSVKNFVRFYEKKNYGEELKYTQSGIEFAIYEK